MVDGSWNGPHWRKTGFPSMGEPTASPTVQSTERVLQKSDRSESLGQVPIDPASGLARLACRIFFFFIQDPSDMHKPTWCRIETQCSMHVYGMGAEGCSLLLSQSTQSARAPEWAVGSFPGFCSVPSTGKAFPANDSFGIAVMV